MTGVQLPLEQLARVATCTTCCRACGSHFSSTAAFDRHRVGSFTDPADPRRCDPPDAPEYESVAGECRISDPPDAVPAVIWTVAGSRESARQAFTGSAGAAEGEGSTAAGGIP